MSELSASVVALLTSYLGAQQDARQAELDKLIDILRGKLSNKPSALEALADLIHAPWDTDAQAAFRIQLRKNIDGDPTLRYALENFVSEEKLNPSRTSDTGTHNVTVVYSGGIRTVVNVDKDAARTALNTATSKVFPVRKED